MFISLSQHTSDEDEKHGIAKQISVIVFLGLMLSHRNEHTCIKAIYIQGPCSLKNDDFVCIEFNRRKRRGKILMH